MQGMADASGGNYYYVDSPGDMSRIFQQEAGAILRTAARSTDVDWCCRRASCSKTSIGYDYVASGGHTYVRIGSVPHDQERFVVFRFSGGRGGQLPIGLVYSDLARRGRFGVSCAPGYDAAQRRARQLGAGARRARGGGLGPSGIDGVGRQRQRDVRHLADRLHARHHRGHAREAGSAGAGRRGQDAARRPGEPGPQGRDAGARSRSWAAASAAS